MTRANARYFYKNFNLKKIRKITSVWYYIKSGIIKHNVSPAIIKNLK